MKKANDWAACFNFIVAATIAIAIFPFNPYASGIFTAVCILFLYSFIFD